MDARARGFCATWNNPPPGPLWPAALDTLACRYVIAGREVGVGGTPHLQIFVYFQHGKSERSVRAMLPGCHVERARGTPEQAADYCRKEDTDPYERGERPKTQAEKGEESKKRHERAWDLAKQGHVEQIDADIRLRLYATIKRIAVDFAETMASLPGPPDTKFAMWIHGLSGAGKSHAVRAAFPDAYPKPKNLWWCGYQAHETVVCDDIDIYDVKLAGDLKVWGDRYPFVAAIKGSSAVIRPLRFIVTSQYQIQDIWSDEPTRTALLRRFLVVEKKVGEEINFI